MLLIDLLNVTIPDPQMFYFSNNFDFSVIDLINGTTIFAQNVGGIKQVDVIGDMKNAWNNFVVTGQVWAMLIGVFLGYTFRSFLP